LIAFRGLLHKEVAARAGIKKRALDMYLGRQHSLPPADVAVRLARVLGVTVEYLVGDDGIIRENAEDGLYKEEKTRITPKKNLMETIASLRKEDRELVVSLVRHIEKLRGMANYK
jgi:transcriptional regulator with XRE-family HTH domain